MIHIIRDTAQNHYNTCFDGTNISTSSVCHHNECTPAFLLAHGCMSCPYFKLSQGDIRYDESFRDKI